MRTSHRHLFKSKPLIKYDSDLMIYVPSGICCKLRRYQMCTRIFYGSIEWHRGPILPVKFLTATTVFIIARLYPRSYNNKDVPIPLHRQTRSPKILSSESWGKFLYLISHKTMTPSSPIAEHVPRPPTSTRTLPSQKCYTWAQPCSVCSRRMGIFYQCCETGCLR